MISVNFLDLFFKVDQLTIIMSFLIAYIGICVACFAARYMKGDVKYGLFFIQIFLLIASVAIMVSSDNLFLFLIASCFGNFTLVFLMVHNSKWKAAKASGVIAIKNYSIVFIFLCSAFFIFYFTTGETRISEVIQTNNNSISIQFALILLLFAAMSQSAIWPFHRWLLSSLNSPSPVSAIMHAGLINGGGFLLVRFSKLFIKTPEYMDLIFIYGIITALLGTLWKLMQNDVKRMLACSTIGQMGFMFVQCGLGLFPFAIAHLFWHGMFKAYLFLASSSAAQEKRLDLAYPPKSLSFLFSLVCGLVSSFFFAYFSGKSWLSGDGNLVILVIVFLSGSQLSLSILDKINLKKLTLAYSVTIISASIYGLNAHFIVWYLSPLNLMQAQKLDIFHVIGIILLIFSWLFILFNKLHPITKKFMLRGYVKALNSSQPHPDTVTSYRKNYEY